MGGVGSGRKAEPKQPIGVVPDFFLPNLSGDHSRGKVISTPVNATDIVNKAYVDALISGAAGSFTAGSGETVTVSNGLVTFITSATFLILLETGDKILMENGDNMENG